jgi:hypothetical protein
MAPLLHVDLPVAQPPDKLETKHEPLSPMNWNSLDAMDFDWTSVLNEYKAVMPLNAEPLNPIVLDGPDMAAALDDVAPIPVEEAAADAASALGSKKRRAAGAVAAAAATKKRARKPDGVEVLCRLQDPGLGPEETASLRREARMARNRASAERTRLRRLEYTANLEARSRELDSLLSSAMSCIQGFVSGKGDTALATRLLSDPQLLALKRASGPVSCPARGRPPRRAQRNAALSAQ